MIFSRRMFSTCSLGALLLSASLLATGLISGCATLPKQPPSFANLGHFEQYQLNTAIYRIRFIGSPDMSQGTAEEIALLQAAKTTMDAGYRYFYVLSDGTGQHQPRRAVVYPDAFSSSAWYGNPYGLRHSRHPFYNSPFYHQGWGWNDPFYSATVVNIDPVDVSYTIKCSKTSSTNNEEFDAQLILSSLGPKYFLNADGTARIMQPTMAQKP